MYNPIQTGMYKKNQSKCSWFFMTSAYTALLFLVFFRWIFYFSFEKQCESPKSRLQVEKLENKTSDPRFIFIDLGANCGNSYAHFKDMFPQISDFYLFEAQTAVYNDWLIPLQKQIGSRMHVYNAAISDVNGKALFFVQKDFSIDACTLGGGEGYPHGGSSLYSDLSGPSDPIEVETIDIARFILHLNISVHDQVILKIDIEGQEYVILSHLLKHGILCDKIDHLYVEWHEPPSTMKFSKQTFPSFLNDVLEGCKVKYVEWTL